MYQFSISGIFITVLSSFIQVKESLSLGGQGPFASNNASSGEQRQQSVPSGSAETLLGKIRSTFASSSTKISSSFHALKEAKVADLAKRSYNLVKEELSGKPNRRKRMHYASSSTGETSDRTEIVVVPVKLSAWSKKWEEVKEKVIFYYI